MIGLDMADEEQKWRLDAVLVAVFRGECNPAVLGADYLAGGRRGPSLNSLAFCAATRRLFVVDDSSIDVFELTAVSNVDSEATTFALIATGITLTAPDRINNLVVRDADESLIACDDSGALSVWSTSALVKRTSLDNRLYMGRASMDKRTSSRRLPTRNSTWGLAVPAAADEDGSLLVVASSNHFNVVVHTTRSGGDVRSSAALGDLPPTFAGGVEVATHRHNVPAVAIGAGRGARRWLLASGGLDGVVRVCSFRRESGGVGAHVGLAAVAERSIATSDVSSILRGSESGSDGMDSSTAMRKAALIRALGGATRDFYDMVGRADDVQRAPLRSADAFRAWFSSRLAARGMRWPDHAAEVAEVAELALDAANGFAGVRGSVVAFAVSAPWPARQHYFAEFLELARNTLTTQTADVRHPDADIGESAVWCLKWLPRSLFRECFPSRAQPRTRQRVVQPPPPSRACTADAARDGALALDEEPLLPLLRHRIFPLLDVDVLRAVACASPSFLRLVEERYERGYERYGRVSTGASSNGEVAAPLLFVSTQGSGARAGGVDRLQLLELVDREDMQPQHSGSVHSDGDGARLMRLATIATYEREAYDARRGWRRIDSAVVLAIPPPRAPRGARRETVAEQRSDGGASRSTAPGGRHVWYDINVLALAPKVVARTARRAGDATSLELELHYLQRKRGSANVGLSRGPEFKMERFGAVCGDEASSADAAALARAEEIYGEPRLRVAGHAGGTIEVGGGAGIPPHRVALWFLLKANREIEVRHVRWRFGSVGSPSLGGS